MPRAGALGALLELPWLVYRCPGWFIGALAGPWVQLAPKSTFLAGLGPYIAEGQLFDVGVSLAVAEGELASPKPPPTTLLHQKADLRRYMGLDTLIQDAEQHTPSWETRLLGPKNNLQTWI